MDELLADDPDDAEALEIRQQLLDSIAALGAAAAGGDTAEPADPTADALPPASMIGPLLPLHAAAAAVAAAAATAGNAPAVPVAVVSRQHGSAARSAAADDQPAAKRQRVASAGSGNARMHPANCYADAEPDFVALAAAHPLLASYVRIRSDGRCTQHLLLLLGLV